MSQLLSSILNLKNKLLEFETQIDSDEIKQMEQTMIKERHTHTKIPEKIKAIIQNLNSSIVLDVRGERLVISKSTIEGCLYESVLNDEIKMNPELSSIYLDFDRNILKELLNIVRYFQKTESNSVPNKYKLFFKTLDQKEFFQLELLSFFKSSSITENLSFDD